MNNGFQFRRARAIARKEVMHIMRDPFTLIVALLIPVFLTIMFGYAIDFDLRHVKTAVYDADVSQTSRMIYQKFMNSKYFDIEEISTLIKNPEMPLAREHAKVSLIIPHKFEENLFNGRGAVGQILIDGSDNTTSGLIVGYVAGMASSLNDQFLKSRGFGSKTPAESFSFVPRYLFNPEQTSSWFIVPGLACVILSILSILLTSLTIAREWETGSMELLLSTPARPSEIIFGKLLPYVFLGLLALSFIYAAARLVFGIPFTGSHIAYLVGSLIFIECYLSMGLFISVVAKNQQLAMQMSILVGYMPSMLLSGFIFPIENMDKIWRIFTMFFPARWYMTICRASYLKGASFEHMWIPFLALSILGTILFFSAIKKFRGNLE